MKKERINLKSLKNLRFGHLGSGIIVFTTEKEEHNDYLKIAHIRDNREIKWYKIPPKQFIDKIEKFAKTANPSISATQEQKVFKTKT
jgi:esterase/lipase superfamily enzyme